MRDIVLTALDYLRWYLTQLLCRWLVHAAGWLARRDDEADVGGPLRQRST